MTKTKICSCCKKRKRRHLFGVCNSSPDKQNYYCKKCQNQKFVEYHKNLPKAYWSKYHRGYRERNGDKVRKLVRESIARNRQRNKDYIEKLLAQRGCRCCRLKDADCLGAYHYNNGHLSRIRLYDWVRAACKISTIDKHFKTVEVFCTNCQEKKNKKV